MKALLIGAGYTGGALARQLRAAGHEVACWVRSEASAARLAADGLRVITGDVADTWIWRGLNDTWDAVVFAASSSGGGPAAYHAIYGKGLATALDQAGPYGRFLYTSSTSVYGQDDGGWVDETSPASALSETAEILQQAEQRVLRAYGTVLRLSGIYGPGRTVYLKKYVEAGEPLPGDGGRWVNMIHRDDAAGAAAFLLTHPDAPGNLYNGTDNEPVRLAELAGWLARETGRPAPSSGAPEDPNRKRGLTSKRISNAKLRSLGWTPRFPSYREGYASLLRSPESGTR